MTSFAHITICGNVGGDPEMRYTAAGRAVTIVSVAVNTGTKDKNGEWINETDWYRVTVWGDRGERVAETVKKGARVVVVGKLKTRTFDGRDGQKRTSLEVNADVVHQLDGRKDADGGEDLSDLPF